MNEFPQTYAPGMGAGYLAPQGFIGGLLGGPVGGLIGRGIGGLFGNSKLGGNIGQIAGGIGGSFLPLSADPVSDAYAQQLQQAQLAQQQQLAPQGWFGNILGQVAQPVGGAIGGLFGNRGIGQTIGGVAGQLGRMLPFEADPVAAAYAQQAQQAQLAQQLAPQGWLGNILGQVAQPVGGAIGGWLGNRGLGQTIGGVAGQLGRMLPFEADPVAAAYAQQVQQAQLAQQLAPQGWLGNILGQVAQPVGGAIGGLFGNRNLGQTIGGVAGQLGRMLPFEADPVAAAYAQQAQQAQLAQQQQLAPQGWFGNILGQVAQPVGGAIGGLFGNRGIGQTIGGVAGQLGRMLPFEADPVAAAYAQQAQQAQLAQQLAPQGWFGNILGQIGQPVGGAIGGLFGNQQLGQTIGGAAGQLGRMLPFNADPLSLAYAQQQQAQLAQQQGQQLGGFPPNQASQGLAGAANSLGGQYLH